MDAEIPPQWIETHRHVNGPDSHGRRRMTVVFTSYEPFDPPVKEIEVGGIWQKLNGHGRVVVRHYNGTHVTFQRYKRDTISDDPMETLPRDEFLQKVQRVYR